MADLRPTIEICTMVYGYQKRYWWQLSSIVGQVPWGDHAVPRISCTASVSRRDPHWGWNDRLVSVFGSRVGLRLDAWAADDETYGRRGHIRTKNLRECQAEWLLYNDGDMVYHPEFFAYLGSRLAALAGEHRVFGTPRMSMSFEDGYRLVGQQSYHDVIHDPCGVILADTKVWPAAGGRISGAGFAQLIHVPSVRAYLKANGLGESYVDPTYNRDHNTFQDTHITRSDRNFRMRCGGVVPLPDLRPSYHLNHYRKHDQQYDPTIVH